MVLAERGATPSKLTNHNDLTNNNDTTVTPYPAGIAGCRLKVLAVKGSKFATAGP